MNCLRIKRTDAMSKDNYMQILIIHDWSLTQERLKTHCWKSLHVFSIAYCKIMHIVFRRKFNSKW